MISEAVGAEMEAERGWPGQVLGPLWEDPGMMLEVGLELVLR